MGSASPVTMQGAGLARGRQVAAFAARAAREVLFCLLAFPLGLCLLIFAVALADLPLGTTLLVHGRHPPPSQSPPEPVGVLAALTGIAVIVLLVFLAPQIARGVAAVFRRLAGRLLGEHIAAPPRVRRGGGPGRWLTGPLRDRSTWRAVAYLVVKLPVTVGEGYTALIAVAGLANLTYPFWWPAFRNHPANVRLGPVVALTPFGPLRIATFPGTFAAFAAGAAMVFAAAWLARAVSSADRWLMRGLLGPGRLAQRVADLEHARALAVDDSAALLRRLERNLHDGAQIRLATLAMNLGMAKEKLGDEGDVLDAAAARELVDAAHRGAKDALIELRGLARGIHPPALDNGLADALATLAADSAIPVELTTSIPVRPSPAIETIAYFCAAELLANAAKHSSATTIMIRATGREDVLLLQVSDDGVGGADPARGSGLSGLAQRAAVVDGRLDVASPPGGPTRITVGLPLRA
jgi:signal transduction histidine kinase